MNSKQVKDLKYLYESVYDPNLRKQVEQSNIIEYFEKWVDDLVEEGYDLSEYSWDDMYEYYLSELNSYENTEDNLDEEYISDNFDYILEYLVSEGYADTNEAALAIMANMSEEWRESIIEGLTPLGIKTAGVVDDQRRGSTRDKDLKDTRDALNKMKPYPGGFPSVRGV